MRTTRLTPKTNIGTSSDEDGFGGPEDIGDVVSLDLEIGGSSGRFPRQPTGGSIPRRQPMGGIDLGKGPDLGKGLDLEKPVAPKSGIGIEIGKSPAGNLGIGVEVPLPVPAPVSARIGVAINPATGQIRGGYGGLGIGEGPIGASIDVGVDTPAGSEDFGCFQYVTISLSILSHTFGRNQCEPKQPSNTSAPKTPNIGVDSDTIVPFLQDSKCYHIVILIHHHIHTKFTWNPDPNIFVRASLSEEAHGQGVWNNNQSRWSPDFVSAEALPRSRTPAYIEFHEPPNATMQEVNSKPNEFIKYKANYKAWGLYNGRLAIVFPGGYFYSEHDMSYPYHITGNGAWIKSRIQQLKSWESIFDVSVYEIACSGALTLPVKIPPSANPPNSFSPSLPNSPPTKKMPEDCCEVTKALQLETLRMLGRQVVNGKLVPISKAKGFIGEEFERTETPIENATNPKKIKIKFDSIYQLLMYALNQANNLDTALDPQSYKPPTGYLQNPKYSRDTETSLTKNNQPRSDKFGNKREFEINQDKETKFSGFIQQQAYVFEAIRRLEYLFPSGELDDAKIAKGLLIPGQKGDIKIHNMIQAYELQMQYLNAILGNPREEVTIKDANPAIKDDQPIKFKALSMSELLRESIKFQMDTAGDLDVLVNMVLRDFRTNLADRITNIQTAEMVTALFEDSGMLEDQKYIKVDLEGDPYAGQWVQGKGFEPNPELDKNTEEATEKVLEATLKNFTIKIKVSRRDKKEKTDMRDLLRGLADFVQRLLSVPASGDAVNKLIKDAKFKVQTDMALIRENVKQAATASRNRTRKRKK